MKSYHNIEKLNGRYVGYSADGRSWRIQGKTGYVAALPIGRLR